jgi:hypothetical protein
LGTTPPKRGQETSSTILIQKKQLFNWDNDDIEDNKALVESDTPHPNLPAKFPGINLKSEQPHHHQVVKIIDVRMSDCCLQGIEPCEGKRKGHRWIGNQILDD